MEVLRKDRNMNFSFLSPLRISFPMLLIRNSILSKNVTKDNVKSVVKSSAFAGRASLNERKERLVHILLSCERTWVVAQT